MISNCGKDEHGNLHGGSAGDQGGEYTVREWYNRPWSHVIRAKDARVGREIAKVARAAANNDKIGYDQWNRLSYYNALSKAKWSPSYIEVKCETDCTASTVANVIAVGHRLDIEALQMLSPSLYSGNIRKGLMATGQFKTLTASKYRTSDKYLLPGDILLYENHHAAINLSTGSAVTSTSTTTKARYTGTFPTLPARGYYMLGDGYQRYQYYDTQIRRVQRFLNWAIGEGLAVDGDYGNKTVSACKAFQTKVGITADGQFGKKTLKKAKAYKK